MNSQNSLVCVIVDSAEPLDALALEDGWKSIPILLIAPAAGEFRAIVRKLPGLRSLNLRVCLAASNDNIRDVRILASVGIPCSIMLEGKDLDWDGLSDLMVYALSARVPHASIEPFDYISRHYDPSSYVRWGGVLFDNPERYFHLDKEKNVALSRNELLAKQFIGHIDEVENAGSPELQRRSDTWSCNFLEKSICATCEGFKLCLGSFMPTNGKTDGCSAFFSEMIEVLGELRLSKEKSSKENVWRS
jgi:hypothetical protein